MRRPTAKALLGSLAAVVIPALLSAQGATSGEGAQGRVGRDTCLACHEDVRESFGVNPHARAEGKKHAAVAAAECESCHGPGMVHSENPTADNIVSFKKLSALKATEACLTCHEKDRAQMHWVGSAHADGKASCVSCHSIHSGPAAAPKLLSRARATDVCLTCHVDLKRSLTQRSRHPILEGKMECTSCHNPHGSGAERLVRGKSVNELCYTCHAEKRGPHLWEHSPVKENCLNCHSPHGSNFEGLLATQTSRLCQQCHIQGRHQTVAGMPNEPWIFGRACLHCHSKIHGSNSPSGPIFQR